MLDEQLIEGDWYLPDRLDRRLGGTLHFAGDQFQLTLRGQLVTPPPLQPGKTYSIEPQPSHVAVVWGTSYDGRTDITLLSLEGDLWPIPDSSATRVIEETWRPQIALLGAHLPPEPVFTSMLARIENLDAWAGAGRPDRNFTLDRDSYLTALEVKAEQRVTAAADIEDQFSIAVEIQPDIREHESEITVGLHARARFTFATPVPWNHAYGEAQFFRDLIRFATASPTAITHIHLRPGGEDGTSKMVKLLLRTTAMDRKRTADVHPHEMLFDLRSVPGGFESGLKVWRQLRELYRTAWNDITSGDDAAVVHVPERFVSYARAIETIHARDYGKPEAAAIEHAERIERAVAAIPDDLREWARPLLEASLPPIARHRIQEIVTYLGEFGVKLVGGDVENFALDVITTRNELIHPTGKPKKHLLESLKERYWYARSLYWLALAYLFEKMGASRQELSARMGAIPEVLTTIERVSAVAAARRQSRA